MFKTKIKVECPKCGYPINTEVTHKTWTFMLFICPDCHSNVVYYDKKTDIISDELVAKLVRENKIKISGITHIHRSDGKRQPITNEDVSQLSSLLKDSSTIDDFIRKI